MASEHMANAMVKSRSYHCQRRSSKISTIEGQIITFMILWGLHNTSETLRKGTTSLLGQQIGDRTREFAIECLCTMGQSVHTTGSCDRRWQTINEFGIVKNRARQDTHIASGSLMSFTGNTIDRCHLRTGKGCGDSDNCRVDFKGESFAQTNSRAAS